MKRELNKGEKSKDTKYLIIGGAVFTVGGLLVYYLSRDTGETSESSEGNVVTPVTPIVASVKAVTTSIISLWRDDSFPLKEKSKGARVTKLQESLKKLPGNEKFQVDGKFGTDTIVALKTAKYPTVIDEKTYNSIINPVALKPKPKGPFKPDQLANALREHVKNKNANGILSVLSQMETSSDYQLVNEIYSYQPWYDVTTAYTIVTDLLRNAYPEIKNPVKLADKAQNQVREAIKREFLRMGLSYNAASDRWAVPGLSGLPKKLITLTETLVEDQGRNKFRVKRNTILGMELFISNGKTFFRGLDKMIYSVLTQDVKYT